MSFLTRVIAAAVALGASTVCLGQAITINPGADQWRTATAQIFIGGIGVPPIPAGFFDPGSEPFTGTVNLIGRPLDAAVSDADTVVQRLTPANLGPAPSAGTMQVELMQLSLQSVNPIMVAGAPPSQWDVRVDLQVHSPAGALIQRTTPTGGTFAYNNLLWTPRFTFTPVGGGPARIYATGSLPTSTQSPPPWATTPLNPLLIPGSGPNFFPQAPMNVNSSAGFQAAWIPAVPSDCNGNNILDSQDLLSGVGVDYNMNRRLDGCETTFVGRQLSFPDLAGGFVQRFSPWGEIGVRTVEPPAGTVLWFNALVNGQWAVRNMPLCEIDGQGGMHTYKALINLNSVGPVTGMSVIGRVTTGQQTGPPAGTPGTVPITELIYNPAGRGPQTQPLIPGAPTDFITPITPVGVLWTEEHRSGVEGVAEVKDGCAPGAAGRSLDWMNDTYCLGFGTDCDTAQEIYAKLYMLMMTNPPGGPRGTTDAKNVAGIQAFINMKMMQNMLSVMINLGADGHDVADAVAQGKDVMGLIGWSAGGGHVITITGVTVCGDNVTIHYRDDVPQDDANPDSDDTKTAGVNTTGAGSSLKGLPANTFDGIIVICPTLSKQIDALTKWIFGDGPGGMTQGAAPLLDQVIGAGAPTNAQLANLKKWLYNARIIARYLLAQLQANPSTPPEVLAAAQSLKTRLDMAYADVVAYMTLRDAALLTDARNQFNASFIAGSATIDNHIDCNGNNIDDSLDIANGTSHDENGNGRLDECETTIVLRQTSWPTFGNTFVQRYSATGVMGIDYIEPPEGTFLWFNAAINGVWVVQNLPVCEIDDAGDTERLWVNFNLGNTPGTQVLGAPVVFRLTPNQQTTMPVGTPVTIPITETIVRPGYGSPQEITGPLQPPVAVNFINPADGVIWERTSRGEVDTVEEVVDGCVPGAGGRCLDWMNDIYCLGFPADCDTAQEIYAKLYMLMMTQPRVGMTPGGTTVPKTGSGLEALLASKGLAESMMVSFEAFSPAYMQTRMMQGKDIIMIVQWLDAMGNPNGWHAITITGITTCGNKVEIEYADDATGGDAQGDGSADFGTKSAMVQALPGGGYTVVGLPANIVQYFFQVCPSPFIQQKALSKWIDGDGAGGMTEGVGPLMARILSGHMPTAAEKKNLLKWACNARDVANYLKMNVQNSNAPQSVKDAAARAAMKAAEMKGKVMEYVKEGMDNADLTAAQALIGAQFHTDVGIVKAYYDCNNNNIDDLKDYATGVLHDANHDQRPDECQCLADWNSDGIRNVTDIFAFLTAWFAGDADFNHDGVNTVADIFAFLSRWFAGC